MRLREIQLGASDPNMTPMIDIVFLLMTFFTLVLNFSQAEQNERIQLPISELAQPPETPAPNPLTLQITDNEEIWIGNTVCRLDTPGYVGGYGRGLSDMLREELRLLRAVSNVEPVDITVIIRADGHVRTGFVQRVIQACQNQGMEQFDLRAKQSSEPQDEPPSKSPSENE